MARERKNKWVAIILAIFGGWCGVHKFYLRDSIFHFWRFFVSPLSQMFAFYEAFILLTTSQEDFDAVYNANLITARTNVQMDMVTQQRLLNEKKALERQNELAELEFKRKMNDLQKADRPLSSEDADRLIAWKNLKEEGLISEADYEQKRRDIMGK